MTEEEKLENEILFYLNDRVEEYNITDNQLRGQFNRTPTDKYEKIIASLVDKKYISHKDKNEKGWTITTEGQKELNNNTILTTTKKTLDLVKFIGGVASIAVIAQSVLLFQQNKTLSKQTELMYRQLLVDSLSKSRYQLVHDTIYIHVRDTTTIKK